MPAETINLIVTQDFNITTTMAFVDPFRVANYINGTPLYRWAFLSEQGGHLRSSNGAMLQTVPMYTISTPANYTIVSASWTPEAHVSSMMKAHLRAAKSKKQIIGALDTGAFILAHCGVLEGYQATVHYEHIDAFQELFPNITVSEALWVMDCDRITCCGGMAAAEFAMRLIEQTHGTALVNAIAKYLFSQNLRDAGSSQSPERLEPVGKTVPDSLRKAIKIMEQNLETPLPIAAVAQATNISQRQMDRLFAHYVGRSPVQYYRDIRLDRARGLVTQTTMPLTEIAYASGFSSQVHFSRTYKARFGLPPQKDRINGRIPFEFRAWPMHPRNG
jgi:transcriptional regulator GlxA family with amidase domain